MDMLIRLTVVFISQRIHIKTSCLLYHQHISKQNIQLDALIKYAQLPFVNYTLIKLKKML